MTSWWIASTFRLANLFILSFSTALTKWCQTEELKRADRPTTIMADNGRVFR